MSNKNAIEDIYPLSPMQEGMLFHALADPKASHYFEQLTCDIKGNLNIEIVQHSMNELVKRYDILRTVFLYEDHERPLQIVLKDRKIDFNYQDLTGLKTSRSVQELICEYQQKDLSRKFNLGKDVLMRLMVLQTSSDEYTFIWSYHHILMDGWCMSIIFGEFKEIYSAFNKGKKSSLPSVTPYSTYIAWLEELDKQEAMDYWKDYLKAYKRPVTLPGTSTLSSSTTKRYQQESKSLYIDEARVQLLKAVSGRFGVTINTIVQAAWSILLGKYNNTEDVVFGAVVSGRPSEIINIEKMVGLFINAVPVRVYLPAQDTVGSVLKSIQDQAIASDAYQYSLLSDIQSLSEPGRELFDHIMVFENYPLGEELAGSSHSEKDQQDFSVSNVAFFEQSNYDLAVVVIPGKELHIKMDHNANRFPGETIERTLKHLDNIIGQIASNCEIQLQQIEILTETEKQQLLNDMNFTGVGFPKDKTVIDLFREQVKNSPTNIAVKYGGDIITYEELDRRTDQLAHLLAENDVKTGHIVGLLMDRSIDTIIGMLSILKAGGAYLPIDVDYPEGRIKYMIEDSGIKILLTTLEFKDNTIGNIKVLYIEDGKNFEGTEKTEQVQIGPADLCYIIYTSGTTGNPKGVMVEHGNVVRLLFNDKFQFDFGPTDVWTMFHSHCFDFSVWEIYGALLFGGKLVVIPKSIAMDPKAYLEVLKKENVTVLNQTPSAFYNLIQEESEHPISLTALHYVIFGGEALSPSKLKKWKVRYPHVHLINMFGITETTVHVTYKEISLYQIENDQSNIGKPIPTLSAYIFDNNQKLVPQGVVGELFVGGAGVSRGYLGKEKLTSEKFIPNPYNPEERLYRTGDLAKLLNSGDIEYIGRIDGQVQLRGFRIELGEIENYLASFETVTDAVVLAKEKKGDKFLIAYYVSYDELDADELRSYLSGELPYYMVPSYFVHLPKLPLTSNAKLDYDALPDPNIKATNDYIAPETEEECLLAEIWGQVLTVQKVGLTDNFFSMGGDSIKSIQISSRMRGAGYEVTIQDIFAYQTIRQLSTRLRKLSSSSDQSTIEGESIPSPIQRWFLEGQAKYKHHYNQSVLLNFPEGISEEAVRSIFGKLQMHHDALRITLKNENGGWKQQNMGIPFPLSIEEKDMREEPDAAAVLLSKSSGIQASIDIINGPLMKLGLFHLKDGSRLLIAIHHLVIDGVSWRILFEDIESLYQQFQNKAPLGLPSKTDSFLSWPSRLQEYVKTNTFEKARQYWDEFHHQEMVPIVPDHSSVESREKDSKSISFQLSKERTIQLLTKVNAAFHTQINDILLTALLQGVKKQYDKLSILIDLEGHGREPIGADVNVSRTIGWFTSIYPMLLTHDGINLSETIKHVKECLRKVPNHGVDYLLYKYLDGQEVKTEHQSQICFNYLGQFDEDMQGRSFFLADEPHGFAQSQDELLQYDWNISGMVTGGQLQMTLVYGEGRYKDENIASLMMHYYECLNELIDFCCNYDNSEFTPSDLSYKKLTIAQLDKLQSKYEIQDVYPLSPMQEGMLFHSLLDANSKSYLGQTSCQIRGPLDISVVEKSMNAIIARYDILRTVFLHKDHDRSLQIVLKERKIDLIYQDIQKQCQTTDGKYDVIESYRNNEQGRALNLATDTLMRLVVLQTANEEYEFIWTNHHILMDGWCMGIIVNEFEEIYLRTLRSEVIALPPVSPYSDYIKWLQGRDKTQATDYWSQYLSSYENLTTLPQKPGSTEVSYDLNTSHMVIARDQTVLLHDLSQKYGVTMNTIFHCAWGLLLAKFNHTDDVVFGSVVSGRPAEIDGIESMIGLFINTVPVRIQYNEAYTVGDLLKASQQGALKSEPHHYHPLFEIQALSELGQNLLDHIVVFENYPITKQIEGNVSAEDIGRPFEIANAEYKVQTNYDLSVKVYLLDQLEVQFDYNTLKYEEGTIDTITSCLRTIIQFMAKNPDSPIKDLSLLEEGERAGIQRELTRNLTSGENLTIQQRLLNSFKDHGRNCAIEYRGNTYTYEELEARADKIAAALAHHRVPQDSYVGIYCEDRYWLIGAILGILKARLVFVPLEITLPQKRLSAMIGQSNISFIITDKTETVLEDFKDTTITCLHTDKMDRQEVISHQRDADYRLDDPIYIYFTSGTTGTPKGVVGRNGGLSHFIGWEQSEFNIDQTFRFSQFTNPGFDVFMRDLFVPLCAGSTICIPDEDDLSTGQDIAHWIEKERISFIHCVPGFFKLFTQKNLDDHTFVNLQYILLAGEKILPYELKDWYQRFEDRTRLVNIYGPTETTLAKGFYRIKSMDCERAFMPIKAISGAQFLILDNNMKLCPAKVIGNIYIRTPYRSLGYINPSRTDRKSFVANPITNDDSDLIYKTGDLGRCHENGEIEILGRSDDQIKIRGIRIELDDIKENLLTYPGIKDAVVIARADDEGEKSIHAYFVWEMEQDISELKTYLNTHLPRNMVPSYLIPISKLPLLPNGKINRKELPHQETLLDEDYVGPANETERKLVRIWSEVLKLDSTLISTTKSFFDLGGHSIRAVYLINKIIQEFSIKIELRKVFSSPSVREQSKLISQIEVDAGFHLPRAEKRAYYPASPAQKRMYYQHLLYKESTAYNISISIRIKGKTDIEGIEQAFQKIIDRHEGLRTSFILTDEGVIQKISEEFKFKLEVLNQTKFVSAQEAFLDFIKPFDLSSDSLFKCGLLQHKKEGDFLFVDIHHIVCDGVSMNILIRDFKKAYQGERFKPLKLRYVDYACWVNLTTGKLEKQKQFWQDKLSGEIPTLDLPTTEGQYPDSHTTKTQTLSLEGDTYRGIKQLVLARNVSDFMFLLSVYYTLLHKISDNTDIIIGTDVIGRTEPTLKDVIGTFVNVLPLRVEVRPGMGFRDLLNQVKECVLDSFDNQDFQFDQMLSLLETEIEMSRNPLIRVHFSFSNTVESEKMDDFEYALFKSKRNEAAEYEFRLEASDQNGKMDIDFIYNKELYEDGTIRLLMEYYHYILKQILKNDNSSIEEIEMENVQEQMN